MDLVALLPWWAGVALAVISFVAFHALAVRPTAAVSAPNQLGAAVPTMILSGLAGALQYIAPMLCLIGALVSFARRRRRAALVESVTKSPGADALNGMTWQEFEMLTAEAFRLQGFQVQEQGGGGADGGVDLVARRGKELFLVQCKQWRAYKVGVDVVRELYGVMAARGAAGGFVVTSGQFTPDAQAFAQGRNVRLIDGTKLSGLLHQARVAAREAELSGPAIPGRSAASVPASAPACPACNAAMVRRTARKGANVGAEFWGCSRFPECRGTRS